MCLRANTKSVNFILIQIYLLLFPMRINLPLYFHYMFGIKVKLASDYFFGGGVGFIFEKSFAHQMLLH